MAAASALGAMPAVGAYLDLAQPDLTAVALELAKQGHRRAVVTPLLFTEAFHATVDVPEAVREAADVSGLELVVSDILGTTDDIGEVVELSMRRAGIGDPTSVLLFAVGSSSAPANDAVHDLADRLGQRRSGAVAAAFGTRSPRATDVLPGLPAPVAIVPLFLSPGLLLDPLAELASERGLTMAPPLGTLAAPVLVARYRDAVAATPRTLDAHPAQVG
jgi:sirohydrochlorin ferrochelatase